MEAQHESAVTYRLPGFSPAVSTCEEGSNDPKPVASADVWNACMQHMVDDVERDAVQVHKKTPALAYCGAVARPVSGSTSPKPCFRACQQSSYPQTATTQILTQAIEIEREAPKPDRHTLLVIVCFFASEPAVFTWMRISLPSRCNSARLHLVLRRQPYAVCRHSKTPHLQRVSGRDSLLHRLIPRVETQATGM